MELLIRSSCNTCLILSAGWISLWSAATQAPHGTLKTYIGFKEHIIMCFYFTTFQREVLYFLSYPDFSILSNWSWHTERKYEEREQESDPCCVNHAGKHLCVSMCGSVCAPVGQCVGGPNSEAILFFAMSPSMYRYIIPLCTFLAAFDFDQPQRLDWMRPRCVCALIHLNSNHRRQES